MCTSTAELPKRRQRSFASTHTCRAWAHALGMWRRLSFVWHVPKLPALGVVDDKWFPIALWVGQRTPWPPRPSFLRDAGTHLSDAGTHVGDVTPSEFCVARPRASGAGRGGLCVVSHCVVGWTAHALATTPFVPQGRATHTHTHTPALAGHFRGASKRSSLRIVCDVCGSGLWPCCRCRSTR